MADQDAMDRGVEPELAECRCGEDDCDADEEWRPRWVREGYYTLCFYAELRDSPFAIVRLLADGRALYHEPHNMLCSEVEQNGRWGLRMEAVDAQLLDTPQEAVARAHRSWAEHRRSLDYLNEMMGFDDDEWEMPAVDVDAAGPRAEDTAMIAAALIEGLESEINGG